MYQVLYRKYRPRVFSDVYGQEHVVSTLENELKENRISHAYLFTGSRGTGKTTCAKILAKAVNCESPVNGEPCNECEVCKGLDNDTLFDVVEIDAASNNGVDNIRDLREEVNYTPSRCKYRVYIIDEVHMLSGAAFNALLKTLEEPPAHVIFILATTEVQKIPATILSRCQRFDFKRIQPETMSIRLKQVAELEGMTLSDDAAILIARIADGALRDGLSILDQCASRSKSIDSALVAEVAGLAGKEALHKLSACVANKDSASAMTIISELYQNSYDMERLCVELINHFRNYLIIKTVKKNRELIVCTDDEYNQTVEGAKGLTLESVIYALDLFQTTLTRIKQGSNSRTEMEMSFVKLCEPKLEVTNGAVLDRIASLERAVKRGVPAQTQAPVQAPAQLPQEPEKAPVEHVVPVAPLQPEIKVEEAPTSVEPKEEMPLPSEPVAPPVEDKPEPAPAENPVQAPVEQTQPVAPASPQAVTTEPFEQWSEFLDVIHKTDIALFGVLSSASAYIRGEHFLLDSDNPTLREFIKISTHSRAVKQAVEEVTGHPYKLGLFKRANTQAKKRDALEDLISKAEGSVNIKFE